MNRQLVAFVALLSVVVSLVSAQDIVFPGETDRPPRFPLPPPKSMPPLPSPPQPVSPPDTQAYKTCVSNCLVTSEYNPVCGTDGVVYSNPGRLNCAFNCGNPVQLVNYGQCDTSKIRG